MQPVRLLTARFNLLSWFSQLVVTLRLLTVRFALPSWYSQLVSQPTNSRRTVADGIFSSDMYTHTLLSLYFSPDMDINFVADRGHRLLPVDQGHQLLRWTWTPTTSRRT